MVTLPCWVEAACDQLQAGGLAGAVGADVRVRLAAVERDVLEHVLLAIVEVDLLKAKDRSPRRLPAGICSLTEPPYCSTSSSIILS